ncbi:MAG: hypothetical protein IBJ12_04805, partial [Sphingomonadaceae bacterium]|nr:hypothetical protein [Sphingomonadaceae bacterium]
SPLWSADAFPARLRGAVVALGNFDGFHIGHQAVFARALELARQLGVPAIAATFDPHPVRFFKPELPHFALTTLRQRAALIAAAGGDGLLALKFNAPFTQLDPYAFVDEILLDRLDCAAVVTGADFRYGHRRSGDFATLQQALERRGRRCTAAPSVLHDGKVVSSTRIRAALRENDLPGAAVLLGRLHQTEVAWANRSPGDGQLTGRIFGDYLRLQPGRYGVQLTTADDRNVPTSATVIGDEDALYQTVRVALPEPRLFGAQMPRHISFITARP